MKRLMHASVLWWTTTVLLGAFGTYFTFSNYPAFGIAVALSIGVLLGYSERNRRQRLRRAERRRLQHRTQGRSPQEG